MVTTRNALLKRMLAVVPQEFSIINESFIQHFKLSEQFHYKGQESIFMRSILSGKSGHFELYFTVCSGSYFSVVLNSLG